ncbi:hypothetical protein [Hymenobacter negativus]|uniref:Uncharacterized protein n=1 Tax=Hymenobacter negativus TaxID=2795026 RepID=A0ABS3Q8T0_9BACT|nr:hypothetical protein [Hymenobacter negativus]MBO2007567.1 hypothetical protein [Hymenobacter negativus]
MLDLTSAGRRVWLSPGTTVQLERNSPLFDEAVLRGAFTYSFTIPAGPNGPLYGFPERPDSATEPGAVLPAELADEAQALLRGTQRLKSASATSYSITLADGLSAAATALSERSLHSFELGGLRSVPRYLPVEIPGATPSTFQLPGLMHHANEVMRHPEAYDYVFAPVRNDDFRGAVGKRGDNDPAPGQFVVNFFTPLQNLVDVPATGSFAYFNNDIGLYTADGQYEVLPFDTVGQTDLPCCPWPRLRFLLRSVLQETGFGIDDGQFLPGEWGELVLVSNAEVFDRGDDTHVAFHLADVVPDLTVAQLLEKLRTSFGLVLLLDAATQRVRTALLADLVASPDVLDLTACLVAGPERQTGELLGVTLAPHGDEGDGLTQGLATKLPGPDQQGEPVETVAELPTTWPLTALQLRPRLVRQQEAFYQSTVTSTPVPGGRPLTTVSWGYLCPGLRTIPLNGGGELLEQGHCYLPTLATACQSLPNPPPPVLPPLPTQALPAMSQVGFNAGNPEAGSRSAELRLLFYCGFQPVVQVPAGDWVYPQLGATSASGQLTTLLDGPTGTYETLLRAWLAVKLRGTVIKQSLALTAAGLAQLDLARKVRLDGVVYLVRKASATLPLTKPVAVELVRV